MCAQRRFRISRFTCWLLAVALTVVPLASGAQLQRASRLEALRAQQAAALAPQTVNADSAGRTASCGASVKPALLTTALIGVAVASIAAVVAGYHLFTLRPSPVLGDGSDILAASVIGGVAAGTVVFWRDCRHRRGRT